MSSICDKHDKAFGRVEAYVIAKDGEKLATIAFKLPKAGVRRLWVYVHWLGTEMVRSYTEDYDSQRGSVAVAAAARLMQPPVNTERLIANETNPALCRWTAFVREIGKNDGRYWYDRLQDAGFVVWQAV